LGFDRGTAIADVQIVPVPEASVGWVGRSKTHPAWDNVSAWNNALMDAKAF
jgi:hypothetical protein